MTPRSDVLILGGGVIGLASALLLLRAGRAVTVLEMGRVGSGSSHGNCGTITPSHLPLNAPGTITKALKWMLTPDAPFRIKPSLDPALLSWMLNFAARCNRDDLIKTATTKMPLLLLARERLEALIQHESLDCEFLSSGTMYVWRDPATFAAAHEEFALLRELGLAVERFDGDEARRREGALNDSIVGGHFHPGDARVQPARYVAELARVVRALGGVIHEHCAVESFSRQGDRIEAVHTSRGEFRSRDIVLALGAWSPQLGRQLQIDLPIQPGKGYSITYTGENQGPQIPLVLKERSVCVTRWARGLRLGATMEFAGYDRTLNRARLDALVRGATEYLRAPTGEQVEEEWFGWRPMTWDELPIIGRAPCDTNLMIATGHGMLGVTLSAITAQLVTELLTGLSPSLDPLPFAPTRF